jgi:4-oxalocrotonate tautomerase
MPLARTSLRRGKSAAELAAIFDGIHVALCETFDVPEDWSLADARAQYVEAGG